ncbi:MAG: Hpt domain-containing protein [Acidimicrobiales bacterium]
MDAGALQSLTRDRGRAGARDVMGRFLTTAPDVLRELRRAGDLGLDGDVRRLAHGLRRSLGKLGGRKAAAIAGEIEENGLSGDLDGLLRQLGEELAAVRFFLQTCAGASNR